MTPPRATIHEVPQRAGRPVPGSARVAPGPASHAAPRRSTNTAPGSTRRFLREERASFGYAFEGVAYAWRTQRHLRIHAAVALVAIGLGLALGVGAAEWAALIAMIALVTVMELLNTVVEVVVDMITADIHPGAKIAKDVSAAAVLLSAAGAVLVGAFIFLPRLLRLLF